MKNTILTLALVSAIAGLSGGAIAGSDCGKCSKKKCDKEAVKEECGKKKCDKAAAAAEGEVAPAQDAPKAP